MKTYQVITQEIIQRLEAGEIPWRKSWTADGVGKSLLTQKPYRGINALLTSCSRFVSPYWLTMRQANELGATIAKGSKSIPIVFWGVTDRVNAKGEESKDFLVRYYRVFNTDQLDHVPENLERLLARLVQPLEPRPVDEACTRAKDLADAMPQKPLILLAPNPVYYHAVDTVGMPERERFESDSEYYAVLFHELAHSTGHASRLDRFKNTNFKWADHAYSREELVAELTAAFLCGEAGIGSTTIDNAAAYCQHWIKALQGDSRLIIDAAQKAQKAADFVAGRAPATVQPKSITEAAAA